MTKAVQRRRGTAAEHQTFTGLEGEITVNTTNESVHVHDGSTAGGFELARADGSNVADFDITGTLTSDGLTVDGGSSLNGIITNETINPRIRLSETDTTDLNTELKSNGGSFIISSANDAFDTFTKRLEIDHSTGDISFYDDQGSSQSLFWDASEERLGINNTSPATALDVNGTITSDGLVVNGGIEVGTTSDNFSIIYITSSTTGESELRMGDTDTDAGSISYTNSDDTMTFRAAAAQRMALSSTGLDITGTLTSDGLTVDGDTEITAASTGKVTFRNGGSTDELNMHIGVNNTGSLTISTRTSAVDTDRLAISNNGDIQFFENTGTTPKLTWDSAAESLGIGTISPSAPLDIVSSATGGTTIELDNTSTGGRNFTLYSSGSGNSFGAGNFALYDADAAAVRLLVDSSGNVGINEDTPTGAKLHVDAGASGDNAARFETAAAGGVEFIRTTNVGNGSTHFGLTWENSDTDIFSITTRNRSGGVASSGDIAYEMQNTATNASSYFGWYIGGTEYLELTSTGTTFNSDGGTNKFYITRTGATNQSGSMYTDDNTFVFDSTQDETSGANFLFRGTNATTTDFNYLDLSYSSGATFNDGGESGFDFRVESDSNTHMLFVDASSNAVWVGTNERPTSGVHSSTTLYSQSATNVAGFKTTGTAGNNTALGLSRATTAGRLIEFNYNDNTQVGNVSITASATSYNTTSDRRLKENIQPITDGTNKLMAMNPVSYTWIAEPEADPVHGFIAQEMQEIVPEAVAGDPDGEEMMGMDYGRITPVLVAALQEAITKIETLEARITALEKA